MAETDHGKPLPHPSTAQLLEDWVTIWQSELAAMVLDRELQDAALRSIDAWAAQARLTLRAMAPAIDAYHLSAQQHANPARHAGPVPPPGPPPAAAEPAAATNAAIAALLARVTELERRLAAIPPTQP